MDIDKIIGVINSAFGENEYPGDDCLVGSKDGCEPMDEILPFIGRTDWKAVEPHVLDSHSGALNFFSEAGLRFFIPSYLVADLKEQLNSADPVFILTHGFSNLAVTHKIGDQEYFRETGKDAFINPRRYGALTFGDYACYRLSVFTCEEAGAIAKYLEHKRDKDMDGFDRDQIETALDSFWYERSKSAPRYQDINDHLRAENEYLGALLANQDDTTLS